MVPGRAGPGVWPDGRVVGTSPPPPSPPPSSGIQVDIQARELYLRFFMWFGGRGERYLRMETGVLHRISIFGTNLMSIVVWPTEPYFENCEIILVFEGSDTFPGTTFLH